MAARRTRPGIEDHPAEKIGRELAPSPMPDGPVADALHPRRPRPSTSRDWTFEPKLDGLRVLARFDGRDLTLLSRNDKPQEARFPEIAEGLRAALSGPAIVDGEVVCLDESGKTSFRSLQQRFHLDDPAEIRRRMEKHPAFLYLFDILYLDRYDLTALPLSRRRELLREAVAWSDRVRLTESEPGRGIESWRRACEAGEEGIVGKRLDSPYVPGRSDAWVKIKCVGPAGVRHRRLDRPATLARRPRGAARRLLRGRPVPLRRQGRHRLHPRGAARPPPPASTSWAGRPTPSTTGGRRSATASTGSGRSWWPRSPSPSGRRTACSASRGTRGSGPTSRPASAAASGRNPPPSSERSAILPGATAMPLDEYNAKRDFTQDPRALRVARAKPHKRPIFVVQEHHASVLHYDFRLEADGVLKSWSVPKGPSLDPAVKRLAVQVEDHPLAYATFEGTIPEGQYGGGTVAIWDHGTYESLMGEKAEPQTAAEAIDAGRIEFVMHGERLKGRFALIRMKAAGQGQAPVAAHQGEGRVRRGRGAPTRPKPAAKPKAAPEGRTGPHAGVDAPSRRPSRSS